MSRFIEALHSGRVMLMDGAMGTELQRAGIQEGQCPELWSLTHPEQVRAIHHAYVDAGADCLLTNTFQANPRVLSEYGLEDRMVEINQAAITLALSAAGTDRFVLGDIGPIGKLPKGPPAFDLRLVERMVTSFELVDAILLETYGGAVGLVALAGCMRFLRGEKPVFLSLAFKRGPNGIVDIQTSAEPEQLAEDAQQLGAAALGVNCGRDIGMDEVIEVIRRYRQVTELPLFARPNAGTPIRAGDQWVYPHTPERMAERLPELLEAGVAMVGGCCGTTPKHIAAFRPIVDEWNRRHTSPKRSS